jgi:hypothetical protein
VEAVTMNKKKAASYKRQHRGKSLSPIKNVWVILKSMQMDDIKRANLKLNELKLRTFEL